MEKTTIAATMAVLVGILLVGSVLVPIIDYQTKETTNIQNTGAGWADFAYYEDGEDYSVALTSDGTTLGLGSQSGTADSMIVWATDNASVIHDGGDFILLYDDNGTSASADLGSSATVASASGTVTVTDSTSTEVYTDSTAAWAYAPASAGNFGFFTATGKVVKDFPTAAAGAFAGAYAYNDLNSLGLSTLAPTYSVSGGVFNQGDWELESDDLGISEPYRESLSTDYRAVPTPSYTDGDWGFNLNGTNATIVSYSGAAGSISIPSTVSTGGQTYTVTALGIGNLGEMIFNNTTISGSTVSIPDTVTVINSDAFRNCTGFTGTLVIPDSVTSIGSQAFYGCTGFTGTLVIPDSVTSIGGSAFRNCTGLTSLSLPDSLTSIGQNVFTGCTKLTSLSLPDSLTSIGQGAFSSCTGLTGTLVIPDSVTSIGADAFDSCSSITGLIILGSPSFAIGSLRMSHLDEVLNLGNTALSAGQYGVPADCVVDDAIHALGYIAPVSFSETVQKTGAEYDLMLVIPIVVIAGLLMAATVWFGLVRAKDY